MRTKPIALTLILILLLSLAACDLPFVIQVQPRPSPTGMAGFIETSVAGTLAAQQSGNPPPPPQAASPTSGPSEPTATLPPTLTPTPVTPILTVSQATYCRTGPGTEYELISTFNVGEEAEVIAKDPYSQSWYVRNPDNPLGFCWVWGQYATITGNTGAIPVFTPPPTPKPSLTPTPVADFTVTYLSVTTCAPQYAVRFMIQNTGSLTWESIRIVVTDNTAAITKTHELDNFRSYNGCALEMNQAELMSGEGGVVSNVNPGQFAASLTGHSMTATITLFTANGLSGTSLSKTINFTP